jgi:hypothetical protein
MSNIQKYFNTRMQDDARSRKHLNPERIIWESPETDGESAFLIDSGCRQSNVCDRNASFRLKGSILIDFGREIYGAIEIITGDNSSTQDIALKVRFGESASEAMQDAVYSHVVQNRIIKVPRNGSIEAGLCGFRFVCLEVIDQDCSVDLKAVRAILYYHDLPYLGSFESSDQVLNDIWDTGAYTVHLNMQEHLWDGIKRDRLVWAGDVHPGVMVINSVFGKIDIVPKTLDYLRDSTPLPGFMNDYCSYSIWWLITQRDWYLYHGDFDYLEKQKDYIVGLIYYLGEYVSEGGLECLENNRFLDWNTYGDEVAIHAGLQALMVAAFTVGTELLGALECKDAANYAADMAATLLKIAPKTCNKQAVALQVLAGQQDAVHANKETLSKDPLQGLSTFYGYYVLKARAMAGDLPNCVEMIKDYWGGMLKLGATTFWESFDMDWLENAGRIDELDPDKVDVHKTYGQHCYKSYRHSLCHAWAAGPTAWLSEYILGVTPTKPGSLEVKIKPPPLAKLGLKFVKGTFPTPHGVIHINHELIDGDVQTKVTAPPLMKFWVDRSEL